MSNKPYKGFEPKWLLTPAPADSYRSIFRWGCLLYTSDAADEL